MTPSKLSAKKPGSRKRGQLIENHPFVQYPNVLVPFRGTAFAVRNIRG